MTRNEVDKSQRRRPRLKLRHVIVALICFTVAGALLLRWHWQSEFQRRIEAIRAAGFPVTAQELDAWYPWPSSGENAAPWITGAMTFWQRPDEQETKALGALLGQGKDQVQPTASLSTELRTLLERHVRSNAQALRALHEAATIRECRYPVDFFQGLLRSVPHLSDVREGCRLLCLEAAWRVENEDPNGAAQAIESLVRVACSLDKEPLWTSHFTRMAAMDLGTLALARALSHAVFTEEQLTRLQKAFSSARDDEGWHRAQVGERCLMLLLNRQGTLLPGQGHSHVLRVPLLEAYNALGLQARAGAVYLDDINEYLAVGQLPPGKRLAAVEAVDAVDARLRARHARAKSFSLGHWIRYELQEAVRLELAVAALAVERYRLVRGSLPERLDELVPRFLPEVPPDPFDGKALRYKHLDRGYTIYSVGPDGTDEGGKELQPPRQGNPAAPYDIPFTVER